MSKFCGNCGSYLDDDALVCGVCGTPYSDDGIGKTKIPGVDTMNPKTKKKIKLIFKLSVVVVVLVVVSVTAVNIISSFTGYKGAINKGFNAFKDEDIDTLMTLTSEIKYHNMDSNAMEDDVSKSVTSTLDSYESQVGHDMSLSYELKKSHKLSDRKYKEFLKYAESNYNYDTSDISEIYLAEIKIYAKGSFGEEGYNSNEFYVIKEADSWYLFNGYIGTNY